MMASTNIDHRQYLIGGSAEVEWRTKGWAGTYHQFDVRTCPFKGINGDERMANIVISWAALFAVRWENCNQDRIVPPRDLHPTSTPSKTGLNLKPYLIWKSRGQRKCCCSAVLSRFDNTKVFSLKLRIISFFLYWLFTRNKHKVPGSFSGGDEMACFSDSTWIATRLRFTARGLHEGEKQVRRGHSFGVGASV